MVVVVFVVGEGLLAVLARPPFRVLLAVVRNLYQIIHELIDSVKESL